MNREVTIGRVGEVPMAASKLRQKCEADIAHPSRKRHDPQAFEMNEAIAFSEIT